MVDMLLPAMDMDMYLQELPMVDMLLPSMDMAMPLLELPMVDMLLPAMDMSLRELPMVDMLLPAMDIRIGIGRNVGDVMNGMNGGNWRIENEKCFALKF